MLEHINPLPIWGRGKGWGFLLLFLLIALASCSEDDNTVEEYPNWQETNETYWNNLYTTTQQAISSGDTSWKIIKSFSLQDSVATNSTDYIIVNVLNEGTGSGCPIYTDSVRIRYTGRLLPSTSYPDGYVFDTTNSDNTTDEDNSGVANMYLGYSSSGSLVNGFATALQYMHIGDKWEIYIPWTLGYGETQSSSSSIPAYSVLRFTVQLVAYSHAGSSLPPFKAKKKR